MKMKRFAQLYLKAHEEGDLYSDRMIINSQGHLIALLTFLFLFKLAAALAQDASVTPVKTQLLVDRTQLDLGDSNQAILILRNTTPYTLVNISIQLKGTAFTVINSTQLPDTLSPYSSFEVEYTLKSRTVGLQNAIFAVQYSWNDPNSKVTHQRIEAVSVEKIEVKARSIINWPHYLIPLLIGFFIGQFGAWFTDWRKQRREKREREEHAKGVTLAILQAAQKGVQEQEKAPFDLWEDAIVKGNLYAALHQFGRAIGKPELSKRLAELSIRLADYNKRQEAENLTEGLKNDLKNELNDLIQLIEKKI